MTRSLALPRSRQLLALALLAFAACSVLCLVWGWVGCIGSDDWIYIQNARERIHDPWMIGVDHWSVRLTMTLPLAFALASLGESEFAAILPTLVYCLATGALMLIFVWRRSGTWAAVLLGLFLAASPLLVINATTMRVDTVENFYVISALLCFLAALRREGAAHWLIAAGVLAGLAFVTRPTTVALLAYFGVLFLSGYGIRRSRYLLVLAGFAVVWIAESLYYLHGTGHWFHRLVVDFNHDQVTRGGTLFDAVVLAPLRMVLASHNLGLTFWLLPPLCWYAGRDRIAGEAVARLVRLLTLFVAVWIAVFSVFASKLVLDPRYLTPALTAALAVIALAVQVLWQHQHRALGGVIALAILATQGLGLYVENKDFMYAEHWLVRLAKESPETIYTDPQTRERALFLLQLAGVDKRTSSKLPPPGGLYLYVPVNAASGTYAGTRWQPKDYEPLDWPVVDTNDPGQTALGRALQAAGVSSRLPPVIWTKISYPNPAVHLLRRPAPAANGPG